MKTERRHDLQTNYLADRLEKMIQKAKPYALLGLVGVVVLVVGGMASSYFSEQTAERNEKNWEAYYRTSEQMVPDRKVLLKAADEYEGTPIEPWALLAAADAALQQGCSLLWIDKAEATKHLNAATSDYQELLRAVDDALLRQRVAYSLAVCYEARGRVEEAIGAYRQVGAGPLGDKAAERADELEKNDDLKSFYDWYAKAELPISRPPSGAGPAGQKPAFDVDSEEGGSFLTSEAQPAEEEASSEEAEEEAEEAAPSESPPAEE